jgi:hypothetical protein
MPHGSDGVHLPARASVPDSGVVPGYRDALTLNRLRHEPSADPTLRNLMDALSLTYELRARYRVFEFEAVQDGAEDSAVLFARLFEAEGEQVTALLQALRERLAATDQAVPAATTTAARAAEPER